MPEWDTCKPGHSAVVAALLSGGADPDQQGGGTLGKCHGGPAAPQGTRDPNPGATVPGRAAAPAGPPVPVRVAPRPPFRC